MNAWLSSFLLYRVNEYTDKELSNESWCLGGCCCPFILTSGSETKSVVESEAALDRGLQPGLETSPTSWCAQLSVDI